MLKEAIAKNEWNELNRQWCVQGHRSLFVTFFTDGAFRTSRYLHYNYGLQEKVRSPKKKAAKEEAGADLNVCFGVPNFVSD